MRGLVAGPRPGILERTLDAEAGEKHMRGRTAQGLPRFGSEGWSWICCFRYCT
jgi:hypothetical protein